MFRRKEDKQTALAILVILLLAILVLPGCTELSDTDCFADYLVVSWGFWIGLVLAAGGFMYLERITRCEGCCRNEETK